MKYLRFASLFLLLGIGLLIPWLTKGEINAKVTDPIGFDQPVFDDNNDDNDDNDDGNHAVSIASDVVGSTGASDDITASTTEENSETSFTAPSMLPPTPTPIAPYPYPGPIPEPLDSINVEAMASQESINVRWELDGGFAGDLQTYTVYRSSNGENGDFVFVGDTPNTQYTDEDESLQTTTEEYCYQVEALGIYGFVVATSDVACTSSFGSLTILVPDQVVQPNEMNVPVTINLANGDGLCVRALDVKIEYDDTIVQANGNVSPTIFTEGYAFEANADTSGEVKISAIIGSEGCADLYGAGRLFDVFFDVIGAQGDISPLDFIEGLTATVIYDEEDLINSVPLILQHGSLSVGLDFIRGDVNGDGIVNAADAALALDIANGLIDPTARQSAACDVNGDGACNSADSSLILCFAAFQDWGQCGGSQTANRLSQRNAQPNADPVVVKIGTLNENGSTLTVPVEISNAADMAGANFNILYDANNMTPTGATLTSLTQGFEIETNSEQEGIFNVSLARATPIRADGAILELQFTMNNGPSSINLGSVRLNNKAGQDFTSSALQREIQLEPYIRFISIQALYLPVVEGGQ